MKIAYISTYLPRECGIATFNSNLIRAISSNFKNNKLSDRGYVVALNDSADLDQYNYPDEVKFIIRQEKQKDYLEAAEYINNSDVDSCILEHEFGIYGGECGIYLLSLLTNLKKPLITILHTVLREPNYTQKLITRQIAQNSASIVVMSKRAVTFLTTIYGIPKEKIQLIEHGVPDLEAPLENEVKKSEPFKNKKTLFTFGLLSRNKGLETVVRALPEIINKHPDVVYVVLGNTHPGVIKNSGEEYRDSLKQLAAELGVADHLFFINKFVSETELINYLTACDIYVTPYLNEAQITSGTLSYAVGAGAAVVSTPYWHAQELLDDNRGRLFNFKDYHTLANTVNDLLDDDSKLKKLKNNAYQYGLHLRWPNIGKEYIEAFNQAIKKNSTRIKSSTAIIPDKRSLPPFDMTHIRRLTDSTGLIQHAKYGIPNYKEGYCLDDNSRGLLLMLMAYQQCKSEDALELFPKYLSYIHYMQREDGNFRNFLSFNRDFLDEKGSEDSFGRTIWALGFLINSAPNNSYREFGEDLMKYSIPHFKDLRYIRGIANTIIGITYYLKTYPSDGKMIGHLQDLTQKMVASYHTNRTDDWKWFEPSMTYDNAILPLALLHSSEITGIESVRNIAIESLKFLEKKTFYKDYLTPIGNNGWLTKGSKAPMYDQQAIETMAMVLMYSQAYHLTQDPQMLRKMHTSFMWFYGENELRIPLYDSETKGCSDGLEMDGINRNQGAESTLACLISHIAVLKGLDDASRHYNIERSSAASSILSK